MSYFVHLNLHTEYSIVDGLVDVKSLVKRAVQLQMPAVAITDHNNVFAMVKFYTEAQNAGVKPIIGSDIWLHNDNSPRKPFKLVVLCQNLQGYRNLSILLSKAYLEGQSHGIAQIHKQWLFENNEGLIVLSGGCEGDVGQALIANQTTIAQELVNEWIRYFSDRYYLELKRTGKSNESIYIQAALELAIKNDVPVVATNDVRFLAADDFEAHEARVCIHEGWVLDDHRRSRRYTEQQYLKSAEEMRNLFSDIPEAITNAVEIAKRCNLKLTFGKYYLPNFTVPAGMSSAEYFAQQSREGLARRLTFILNPDDTDYAQKKVQYEERLETEIRIIDQMGFPGYFLIVADFVRWSKENNIPVGPGRGSGAGSLVAYALSITELDPLAHDLLFERFLNPERVSMADFDIDFCMEGRDRVIDYVAERYGRDSVSQIITYGTMAARAVVRDVGRVLGFPYGFVDKVAKLIPFELGMTLEKALATEDLLQERYEKEDEIKTLIDLAVKLEGVPRNVGKHAGGVVIAPSVLTDFLPLYCEEGGQNRVSQFDKNDVETIGLVKFDFLGLRTLTIIDWTLQRINQQRIKDGEQPLDINRINLNDQPTYELLKTCQTTAVFQLESRGMKDLVKRLQPDCFDDIVALVALFRPGPLQSGMVDDYVNRKHGRAKVEYSHPLLEPILKSTYGVILYQEQVMQIAQVLAGYTLGGADLLRRAMGKKKPEEMAKQRTIFVTGAKERNIAEKKAEQIFDLMEKFADYGFNKSHSAAYALLTYQTAWLKTHYTAEFMAAVLSSDMDNTDKVVRFLEDCKQFSLDIVPPDLNRSQYKFTALNEKQILYGLGAIKGVGEAVVESILESRLKEGQFKSLFELCNRVDVRKVNRKVLEALIRSGAMDCFGAHRGSLLVSVDVALQNAEQQSRNIDLGQNDLFGSTTAVQIQTVEKYVNTKPLNEEILLAGEKETLGWYVSGHPISKYQKELQKVVTSAIADLKADRKQVITVAGYTSGLRTMNTRNGQRIAFLTLDDNTGRVEVAVFTEAYQKYRHLLAEDQLLVVQGEVSVDDFSGGYRLSADAIYSMQQIRERYAKRLSINLFEDQLSEEIMTRLHNIFNSFKGGRCPVNFYYHKQDSKCQISLGNQWHVIPSDAMLSELHEVLSMEAVFFDYQ